jgi:hypothetical protein
MRINVSPVLELLMRCYHHAVATAIAIPIAAAASSFERCISAFRLLDRMNLQRATLTRRARLLRYL